MPLWQYVVHNKQNHIDNLKGKRLRTHELFESVCSICQAFDLAEVITDYKVKLDLTAFLVNSTNVNSSQILLLSLCLNGSINISLGDY